MIGKQVAQYTITEQLGGGGMGVVYKAEDTRLRRNVALKFLPPAFSDPTAIKRLEHEAQNASALDHPNICTIYEIGSTTDGQPFIAMACYDGKSLAALIESIIKEERPPLTWEDVATIILPVAHGLARAHEAGIIHRDIKPANIMQTSRGEIKILDFGLAKLSGQTRLTREGVTLGTIAYMSPEQARGDAVDQRSDIWSLGVLLYELITLDLPFRGDYDQAIIYSILNELPHPLADGHDDIPDGLATVIETCLAKNPADRYQTVDELIADLERIDHERDKPRRRRRPRLRTAWMLTAGIFLLLAITNFVLIPFMTGDASDEGRSRMAVIGFQNQTGDPQYDYFRAAIPNLLITSLEQVPGLQVTTWEKLNDLRRQIDKEDIELIDEQLGFQLCRHAGIDIVISGSIIKAGDIFVTDVRVLNSENKELLHSARAQGTGVGSILTTQIDDLSQAIGTKFTSAEQPLTELMRPVEEITTSSMTAYNFFLRGRSEYSLYNLNAAHTFLSRAIEADSAFAPAYLYLALTNLYLAQYQESRWAIRKASELSYRSSPKERLYIDAFAARLLDRDYNTYVKKLQQLIEAYPHEQEAYYFLSEDYLQTGQKDRAFDLVKRAFEIDPASQSPLHAKIVNSLSYAHAYRREFDRALELNSRYAQLQPGEFNTYHSRAEILFWKGDWDAAIEHFNTADELSKVAVSRYFPVGYIWAVRQDYDRAFASFYADTLTLSDTLRSPVRKAQPYFFLTILQTLLGNYQQAEKDLTRAQELYNKSRSGFLKFWLDFTEMYVLYIREDYQHALEIQKQLTDDAPIYFHSQRALLFAKLNKPDSAAWHIKQAARSREDSPSHENYIYDICYAEYLFEVDSLRKAIRIAEQIDYKPMHHVYPLIIGMNYNMPFYRDVLPRSYWKAGQIDQAIAAYEELIDVNPHETEYYITAPIYYYRLAQLYETKGHIDQAIKTYQKFLDLWRNAPDSLPQKQQARSRLTGLRQ